MLRLRAMHDPRVLLFVLALTIRLAFQIRVGFYEHPVTWEYDQLARNLVSGAGYSYRFFGTDWTTFGTPAYPLLLAGLHLLSGGADGYLFVGLFQALASAALTLVAFAIARRLSGNTAAVLAGVAIAVHPGLVLYATEVHELTFESLLAGLVILGVLRAAGDTSTGHAIRLGLFAGAAALTRPTLASFGALGIAALALRPPRFPRLISLAIVVLVAAPWTIRNVVVLGGTGPSAPYNCVTLWIGNNARASGGLLDVDGKSLFNAMPDDLRQQVEGMPESVQGSVFCQEAIRFMTGDPARFASWWATKFFYFWWFSPSAGIFYPTGWIEAYRMTYAIEVVLVLVGVLAVWRRGLRVALGLLLLELLVVSASQSLFYVEGRHRLLLEPTLAALAAAGAVSVATIGSARVRSSSKGLPGPMRRGPSPPPGAGVESPPRAQQHRPVRTG